MWKKGARLRVDGTLMGVEDEGPSLIPRWRRGHFSLLFDGSTQVPALLFSILTDRRQDMCCQWSAALKTIRHCTNIHRLQCRNCVHYYQDVLETGLPALQPSTALLVNWDKRTYVNLQTEKKKAKPDADVEVRHGILYLLIVIARLMRRSEWGLDLGSC